MGKYFFFILLSIVLFQSCKSGTNEGGDPDPQATEFGGKFDLESPIAWDSLLVKLNREDTIFTQVLGQVNEVCQASGCWMNVVNPDKPTDEALFVKFEGYSFFVPKEIAGKQVQIAGKAYREETSVEELKHYAEDEGQSEEEIAKITEPLVELKFMATGVKVIQ